MAKRHDQAGQAPEIEEAFGIRGIRVGGRFYPLIAGAEDDPQNPPANPPVAPPADPPAKKDDEPFDKERAMATISKLRGFEKISKDQQRTIDDLTAKLQSFEDANKSELEKAQTKAADLEQKLTGAEQKARDRAIRSEVRIQASELGFADPSDALAFIDQKQIELDEDGEPKNVKTLLEAVLKAKPYLAKAQSGGGVPASPKPDNGQPSDEERRKVAAGLRHFW
jgi:hypothetical protein